MFWLTVGLDTNLLHQPNKEFSEAKKRFKSLVKKN